MLTIADLLKICAAACDGKQGEEALRDEVLAGLFCFSPLRPGEIQDLTWEQVTFHEESDAWPFATWVKVQRGDRSPKLPIHKEASRRLASFYSVIRHMADREPGGPVFLTMRRPYVPLSRRQINAILKPALEHVASGLQSQDLRAAYAFFLMERYELTVPDLHKALGYRHLKHVQQLVAGHLASGAKRLAESVASKATRKEETSWLNLQFLE